MATFFGALVVTGLTAALHLGAGNRSVLPWVAAVFVLYLVAVVITLAVNVPLNDGIKAAGPRTASVISSQCASGSTETRWAGWNLMRTY